ncbi:MAG: prepilin-type N-terminal cleavage/methylation domain-containing protein [Candidatus Paceibacterota bacterium]
MKKTNFKKGIGLVEVLVAVFIFSVILTTLITACNLYLSSAGSNLKFTKAAYLAEEGIEAVKTVRDAGWSNISSLTSNIPYFLSFSTTTSVWQITSEKLSRAPEFSGDFDSSFTINSVSRNADGYHQISSGGVDDPNTKLLTVSVSWQDKGSTTTKSISTYITNILN